ncbi:unnamed protein product [Pleuronectes platessa]|uniref:Uncharacterized protein n=1 Tax=Pleuronectes platessa TaxID=8262 RepID=A0A9N7TR34_PLEPL|nr:unnamed protein product [Pleuronectes platessa]
MKRTFQKDKRESTRASRARASVTKRNSQKLNLVSKCSQLSPCTPISARCSRCSAQDGPRGGMGSFHAITRKLPPLLERAATGYREQDNVLNMRDPPKAPPLYSRRWECAESQEQNTCRRTEATAEACSTTEHDAGLPERGEE